jgi:hypothetical protein
MVSTRSTWKDSFVLNYQKRPDVPAFFFCLRMILPLLVPGISFDTSTLEPFGQLLHLQAGAWSFSRLTDGL